MINKIFDGTAVDIAFTPNTQNFHQHTAFISSVLVAIDNMPTTSERLQVIYKNKLDSAYDTILFSVDPSTSTGTDHFWNLATGLPLTRDEEIQIVYPNSDGNTIAITIKESYM